MITERVSIKNRHGLKLVIQVDAPDNPKKLVFIAHGQGGFIEQVHIQAFADVFLENNFRVVRFDATNSIGESGGDMQDVTTTNYLEDLEDTIDWAKQQDWYQEPFALCGHSMGGMTTAFYASSHPEKVKLLAPLSTVLNHDLNMATRDPEFVKRWQKDGYFDSPSASKPGVIKRIGWGYVEDLEKYDLLKVANKLNMPVLLIVGKNDHGTPYEQQKMLFDAISHKNKKLFLIKDADHNYRGSGNYDEKLNEVKNTLSTWLRDIKTY